MTIAERLIQKGFYEGFKEGALEVAREIACRLRDMGWTPERIQEVRIPLYSITDWHRSPISDSHPFDQPGT
ncbi:hypothetical protein [Escherichia coli]|uniref:hypothetical protein n=1 Tax=Escherichia coli TaxID=562 RepID=UPI00388DF7AA|nr:hypothetical protein [Escherichia coli]